MRVIFAEARALDKVKIRKDDIRKLPERVGLFTTVQFIGQLREIIKEIEKSGRMVILSKGKHSLYEGQILGCDAAPPKGVDAHLYIGMGLFHPLGIALKTDQPVFILDPESGRISRLENSVVEREKKRRKAAVLKFLSAKKLGILVSIKPGQFLLERALSLKRDLEGEGKKVYVLLFDTLDFSELEDFPFIECFLNLACPRIAEDFERFRKPIVNYEDIALYLKGK